MNEYRRERQDQRHARYTLRQLNDFLSCSDAVKAWLSKGPARQEEIESRAPNRLEKNLFGNFGEERSEDSGIHSAHYAYQVAMGAPQTKKRKSDVGNFRGCVADAMFSKIGDKDM